MDPTSLPTDNLYKLWTIAALFAIGAHWYSTYKLRNQQTEELAKAYERNAKHNIRGKHLSREVEAAGENMSDDLRRRLQESNIEADELRHASKLARRGQRHM